MSLLHCIHQMHIPFANLPYKLMTTLYESLVRKAEAYFISVFKQHVFKCKASLSDNVVPSHKCYFDNQVSL